MIRFALLFRRLPDSQPSRVVSSDSAKRRSVSMPEAREGELYYSSSVAGAPMMPGVVSGARALFGTDASRAGSIRRVTAASVPLIGSQLDPLELL